MKKIASFFLLIWVCSGIFLQASQQKIGPASDKGIFSLSSTSPRGEMLIEGYTLFKILPAELVLHIFEFLPDATLAVTSCVDKIFNVWADAAARDRLQEGLESTCLLAYLKRGKYVSGLLHQNLISEVWHVFAGVSQTNTPLDPSWTHVSSQRLSRSVKSGHPLLEPTLKLLEVYEGKTDPVSVFSQVLLTLESAPEGCDLPSRNAELLSILHMTKLPERKEMSFFSKIGAFFFKAKEEIRVPEGFETARKYALQAARGGHVHALQGLLLTQVDLFKLKTQPTSFFQGSLDTFIDFYEGVEGKPLATLFIEYENTFETLEKFQKAFLIALDLEGVGSSEALEKLMLFYHFSAVTFLRYQRVDLLKEKVLNLLLEIDGRVTSVAFKTMERWIFSQTLATFLSLEVSLKSKLEERLKAI